MRRLPVIYFGRLPAQAVCLLRMVQVTRRWERGVDVMTSTPAGGGTAERPDAATPRRDRPFGARFVSPLLLGAALNPINSSVIATALVAIALAMHVSVG